MESRFAFLHKRDTSASTVRRKMSRRLSQTQKENREKTHNSRRKLEDLSEVHEMSTSETSLVISHNTAKPKKALSGAERAAEERKAMLARYQEAKKQQREKERLEREKKGVFKCGLYQPTQPGFVNTKTQSKAKNPDVVQSKRVTRSMAQQQHNGPAVIQKTASKKEDVKPLATRGQPINPLPAVPKAKPPAVVSVTRATRQTRAAAGASKSLSGAMTGNGKTRTIVMQRESSPVGQQRENPQTNVKSREKKEKQMVVEQVERKVTSTVQSPPSQPAPAPVEDSIPAVLSGGVKDADEVETEAETSCSSFAPKGFVFEAPAGILGFQTISQPPSQPACSSTCPSFEPVGEPGLPASPPPSISALNPSSTPPAPSAASAQEPSISPTKTNPVTADTGPTVPPGGQQLEQHGVPYFRAVLVSETERLTGLSQEWEVYFDDISIPEEMRDRMRTAVGQARLLMKERFSQFSGLVDDCEFGRGEKATTCTDLEGFWDMVYFQVEDVDRKFAALKEAKGRGWIEDRKPPPRVRRVVKKPPAEGAAAPTAGRMGAASSAAAKSRLAAIKAAMRARQQQAEAQKAGQAEATQQHTASSLATPTSEGLSETQHGVETVVFQGGFFQVESPRRPAGSVRSSFRLCATPTASPMVTPSRPQRPLAIAPVHSSPNFPRTTPVSTPARAPESSLTPACCTPKSSSHPPSTPAPSVSPSCLTTTSSSPSDHLSPIDSSSSQQQDPEPIMTLMEEPLHCPSEAALGLSRASEARSSSPPVLKVSSPPSSSVVEEVNSTELDGYPSTDPANSSPVDVDMSATPETSIKDAPGIDFERYLQATAQPSSSLCEGSPGAEVSPMAVEMEIESPHFSGNAVPRQQQTPTGPPSATVMMPRVLPQLHSHTEQPEDTPSMLPFTPEQWRDRIRESMCGPDLMTFTPPTQ